MRKGRVRMINLIVTGGAVVFLVLGGADYLLGGRLGLGGEFERGILAAGRLLMCMTGLIVLAPVLAQVLALAVSPVLRGMGADPSALAGLFFANDSGGSALAMALADDPAMGLFHGLISGAMLGSAVMFVIPLSIANTAPEQRQAVIFGLACGILTTPLGCVAGGLAAGFPTGDVVRNTLPTLLLSLLLAAALVLCREAVVVVLSALGKGILAISTAGLVLASVQRLTGIVILPDMGSLDVVFSIVGGICIFLAGIFPLLEAARRLLARPLAAAGRLLAINDTAVSGLLLALANGIPVMSMLGEMDSRGRMLNTAFLVCVSCVFGDHLAYTSQVAPELAGAVIIGKLAGGLSALLLALYLAPRLLPADSN